MLISAISWVRHDDSLGIGVAVQFAADGKAGLGRRGADQVDDHAIADERLSFPVHGDEREKAVLDLVPFAGPRRQVMDDDVEAQFVGEAL